jgi:GNAT superfamily N-acetyltransferase
VTLRRAVPADVAACARIVYDAFKSIGEAHRFPPSFSSLDAATRVSKFFIDLPAIWSLVAEHDGRLVGAVFLDEGDAIRGVALIAVEPSVQQRGVGRRLMEAALERARGGAGVRLVQEAYNTLAMSLYASLGFEVKEPLVRVTGRPRSAPRGDITVRTLGRDELDACARLCARVHGFDRSVDLRDALRVFSPFAALRDGRVVAYTYAVFGGSLAWGVAETEEDMRALLLGVAAGTAAPLAFLVPTRQASFFRWCLAEGLHVEKPLTLMAMGQYEEPRGCYFPSGIY